MVEIEIEPWQVAFETASGSLVLDSTHCQSPACLKHRRYVASGEQLNQVGGVVRVSERATLSVDYNEDCGLRRSIGQLAHWGTTSRTHV